MTRGLAGSDPLIDEALTFDGRRGRRGEGTRTQSPFPGPSWDVDTPGVPPEGPSILPQRDHGLGCLRRGSGTHESALNLVQAGYG